MYAAMSHGRFALNFCMAIGCLSYPDSVLPQHIVARRMLEQCNNAQLQRLQIVQEAAQCKGVTAHIIGLTPRHLRQNRALRGRVFKAPFSHLTRLLSCHALSLRPVECNHGLMAVLFQGPETMQAFMWQDDLIGVAKFVNMCLNKVEPPLFGGWGGGGGDVM